MKNSKIPLHAETWQSETIKCPLELIYAFFEYTNPAIVKNCLTKMLKNAINEKCKPYKNPEESLFIFNLLRSMIRAAYKMYCKPNKYFSSDVMKSFDTNTYHLFIGNLAYKEYINLYFLFKSVFKEQSLQEIENDLADITEHVIGKCASPPSDKICISFININGLLDACWLICNRKKNIEDV